MYVEDVNVISRTASVSVAAVLSAVGPGDDLQVVPVRVGPVDTAPAIVGVDPARLPVERVGPVRQALRFDPLEDLVEFVLGDQECVVLWIDRSGIFHEVQGDVVCDAYDQERSILGRFGQAEQLYEELGRASPVARVHDGVVELNGHMSLSSSRRGVKN